MSPGQNRERVTGCVVGGWLLLHQFLLGEPGPAANLVIVLLCVGILLRMSGFFPPAPAVWLILAGAGVFALFAASPSAGVIGALAGMFAAVLLLRPLSPCRGDWVLLCAVVVLAAITLQKSEAINTAFLIIDVAVLMFLAQQVHAPAGADAAVWESLLRSLRLILPVAFVVSLVFWLFPAISSRTNVAFVRFAGDDVLNPGDSSEVRLTHRIAFVATFPEVSAVSSYSDLYWRGQILEKNDGLRWAVDPARINSRPAPGAAVPGHGGWRYSQLLGPDRTLAALDRPVSVIATREGERATVLETGGSVFAVLGAGNVTLEISSSPSPAIDPPWPALASGSLGVPEKIRNDPRLRALSTRLFSPGATFSQNISSLGRFLAAGEYSYTLRPGRMEPADVSWFLFQHRQGFCGHYAAVAANVLRIGGIPARVVTGFRGGTWNPWLRTFTVRDSDAHAWVEAWDASSGQWLRFDPTSYVAPGLTALLEYERSPDRWPWIRQAATYAAAMAVRAGSRLESARNELPASWALGILLSCLAGLSALWWRRRRRSTKSDLAGTWLSRLENHAACKHLPRLPGETPLAWLTRLEEESAPGVPDLRRFASSYERLVYAPARPAAQDAASLQAAAKRLIRIFRMQG